jgi:hypothetical protein
MSSTAKHQVKRLLIGSMIVIALVLSLAPASLAEGKVERFVGRQNPQGQSDTGAIVGMVYNDWNQNGAREENEPTLADAMVTLLDMRGETVAQVITGEDGAYGFEGLRPGGYILVNASALGYSPMNDGKLNVIVRADEVVETEFGDVLLLLWGEDQPSSVNDQVLVVERTAR